MIDYKELKQGIEDGRIDKKQLETFCDQLYPTEEVIELKRFLKAYSL